MANQENARSKLVDFLRSPDHSDEVRLLGVLLANFIDEELGSIREELDHEIEALIASKEDS